MRRIALTRPQRATPVELLLHWEAQSTTPNCRLLPPFAHAEQLAQLSRMSGIHLFDPRDSNAQRFEKMWIGVTIFARYTVPCSVGQHRLEVFARAAGHVRLLVRDEPH